MGKSKQSSERLEKSSRGKKRSKRPRSSRPSLENALKDSRVAARSGHRLASESLDNVDAVIRTVSQDIQKHLATIETGGVQTDTVATQLREQLVQVVTSLHELSQKTRRDLKRRAQELDEFSVTLFGRTMAGKSTLMEILTDGDGSSIGKGQQRTTRDVRVYSWKGLRIIDVPGVAAFDGQDDEDLAYEAAAKSDLMIFLITDNKTEDVEAEGLAKVRSMGKPILGVCNIKYSFGDSEDLELFLYEPKRYFPVAKLEELVRKFHRDVDRISPGYPVHFSYVNLRARFLARQPGYDRYRDELERASDFKRLEQRIIDEVAERGKFLREKSFIDGAVVPLLDLSEHLLAFSAQNSTSGRVLIEKSNQLKNWRDEFHDLAFRKINLFLDKEFGFLRGQIPVFAESYYNRRDAGERWVAIVKRQNVDSKASQLMSSLQAENHAALQEIARQLKTELTFVSELSADKTIQMSEIYNSRFMARALGALGGALAFVVLGSTPLGWAVRILLGSLGLFFDSASVKRHRQRRKLENELYRDVNRLRKKLRGQLLDMLFQKLLRGQIGVLSNDLNMVTNGVFALADIQRELAWDLNAEQKNLHRRLLRASLQQLQRPELEEMVDDIARVPGVAITLMLKPNAQFPYSVRHKLSSLLEEDVWVVVNNGNQHSILGQTIGKAVRRNQISIERKIQVAHLPIDTLNAQSLVRVRLAQQLTELHVMK